MRAAPPRFRKISALGVAIVAACWGCLAGCGKQNQELADVRGEVTFCGLPAVAEVLFEPIGPSGKSIGRASTATTDKSGSFRLMLDDSQSGARIGPSRVTLRVQRILSADGTELTKSSNADGMIGVLKQAHFARDVQAGSNHFSFHLSF